MNNDLIEIKINGYGALRSIWPDNQPIIIKSKTNTNLIELMEFIINYFGNKLLLSNCVFADDNEILNNDTVLSESCTLSLLPPVCGG